MKSQINVVQSTIVNIMYYNKDREVRYLELRKDFKQIQITILHQ